MAFDDAEEIHTLGGTENDICNRGKVKGHPEDSGHQMEETNTVGSIS